MCVCVCVCVCEREREREASAYLCSIDLFGYAPSTPPSFRPEVT